MSKHSNQQAESKSAAKTVTPIVKTAVTTAKVEVKVDPVATPPVGTEPVADMISQDLQAATGLLVDEPALPKAQESKSKRKAYKVTAVQPNGFRALNRNFAHNKPEVIPADTLTKAQADDLMNKPRQALLVEVVEID